MFHKLEHVMLDLIGYIFNRLATGVLFPLMLLPLAFLFSERRALTYWVSTVLILVGAGVVFVYLTPVLRATPTIPQIGIFVSFFSVTLLAVGFGSPKKFLVRATDVFEKVTRITSRAVMWLLLVMALVQFAVVLLRHVFGVNWIFMQESVTYMHGFVFLLASGYALLTDDHVRVDIFYREAPAKRKAVTDLLGTYLFLFPICLIILWTASPYVGRSWFVMEGSADTSGIQGVFILKTLIPAFAVLLSMAGFVIAARAVDVLKGRSG